MGFLAGVSTCFPILALVPIPESSDCYCHHLPYTGGKVEFCFFFLVEIRESRRRRGGQSPVTKGARYHRSYRDESGP